MLAPQYDVAAKGMRPGILRKIFSRMALYNSMQLWISTTHSLHL